MYRLVLKLVGILVVAGVVWWRMEGKPLPGFLSGDGGDEPSGLVYGPDGEIDMSQVYGSRVEAPADAAAIVFSLIGDVVHGTQQAAEIAKLRQERGCGFSTLPDMSDCPDPAAAGAAPAPAQAAPTVVTGGTGTPGSGGVVVFRPHR